MNAVTIIVSVLSLTLGFLIAGVRWIPNDRVGVVEKRFGRRGSIAKGLIALGGEAGFQPELLRGGLHWRTPLQYRVHVTSLVTVPQGRIGYVFARDGFALGSDQTLGKAVPCDEYQNVSAFLRNGGQKGPQRAIVREGTYAIHLAQFVVITAERVHMIELDREDVALFRRMQALIAERDGFVPAVFNGEGDRLGVVTVHDGPALAQGEIIAPVVGRDPLRPDLDHRSFQDPDRFLAAGGLRGRQLEVLVEGTYFLNRLFVTVESIPKTVVEVGYVGVVVSYTGNAGGDVSGAEYKHGELVESGKKGVWSEPLLPGKYAFNTYAGRVVMVPTTNFILKWIGREVGAHHYDENLSEVTLITRDAFEPSLPLSVVVHIDYRKAPLVVQRFGDVRRLVEQTLDPMVSAYFKNVGQMRTLIELLRDRSEIQRVAGEEMKTRFDHYNLELEEVLIGTPASSKGDQQIEQILEQLRMRQIAEERVETYDRQQRAAVKERELREAEARANEQRRITESELSIAVAANEGRARYERSVQEAAQIRALAGADADKVRALADAEAERVAKVGVAEAMAIEEQVRAYGGPRATLAQKVLTRFSEAVEKSGVDVVPRIVVGGRGEGGGSSLFETLMATMLDADLAGDSPAASSSENPAARSMRERLGRLVRAGAETGPSRTP
jgi:uncharacterized membrane protein YqiK